MSLKFRLAFGAIVLAQVFLLIGLIGQREYSLRHGTEVVLETRPVDPRSLFQGDYAVLLYEISRPPSDVEFSCTSTWKRGLSPGAALTIAIGATVQTNVHLSKGVWETTET